MKPSSTNRQLPGLSGIRGQPTASPELRFGWMQATIRFLSERKGGEFFLDIPSYRAHRAIQMDLCLRQVDEKPASRTGGVAFPMKCLKSRVCGKFAGNRVAATAKR